MTFGSETNHEEITNIFGEVDKGQHTMFNMFHPDSKVKWTHKMVPEETNQDYFYFAKIVPHLFEDIKGASGMQTRGQKTTYSYSLKHNKKATNPPSPGLGTIVIKLDYAPIMMIITKIHSRPLGQFCINMCSIIGGIFIIFGLLNGIFLKTYSKIKGN